jgi:hypothetical protein
LRCMWFKVNHLNGGAFVITIAGTISHHLLPHPCYLLSGPRVLLGSP